MLQFILKITGFLTPFVVVLGMAVGVAMYSGEAMPLRSVINLQEEYPQTIYLPDDREKIFAYKWLGFVERQPEVLMLGSSRSLNFRSAFLNNQPDAFFNGGASGMRLREIEAFVNLMTPETAPKVLLISSDQFWYNSLWLDNREEANISSDDIDLQRVLLTTRKVWQKVYGGELTILQVLNPYEKIYGNRALGVEAIVEGAGYKADGSRQTDVVTLSPAQQGALRDQNLQDYWAGRRHYQRGNQVSAEAMEQTERILQKAAELGIEVIGFSPPFLPEIYHGMVNTGQYQYLDKSGSELKALYEKYGFLFFDYTDASVVGGTSEEMIDGIHPSEMLSLRIYMALVEVHPELLGEYSDLPALQRAIENAANTHEVFPKQTE